MEKLQVNMDNYFKMITDRHTTLFSIFATSQTLKQMTKIKKLMFKLC